MFMAIPKTGVGNQSVKKIIESGEIYMDAAYFSKSKSVLRRVLTQQGLQLEDFYIFELKMQKGVAIEQ